ncbi:4616_t:CDS:2, partial [Ambispora gerdemannii]
MFQPIITEPALETFAFIKAELFTCQLTNGVTNHRFNAAGNKKLALFFFYNSLELSLFVEGLQHELRIQWDGIIDIKYGVDKHVFIKLNENARKCYYFHNNGYGQCQPLFVTADPTGGKFHGVKAIVATAMDDLNANNLSLIVSGLQAILQPPVFKAMYTIQDWQEKEKNELENLIP